MTKKAEASGVTFCYLPNCRVLKDLRSKPLTIDDMATAKFNEKWVTLDDVKVSMEHGDVDFSKSNKSIENGKLYIIEGRTIKNQNITIEMISYNDRVILKDIKKE